MCVARCSLELLRWHPVCSSSLFCGFVPSGPLLMPIVKKRAIARAGKVAPKQVRSVQTRERLLDVAGELLAEVGIERISTNLICARAGVTPPALYRYFKDKYAVLEALGRRLMDRQNEVLFAWLDRHAPNGLTALA